MLYNFYRRGAEVVSPLPGSLPTGGGGAHSQLNTVSIVKTSCPTFVFG